MSRSKSITRGKGTSILLGNGKKTGQHVGLLGKDVLLGEKGKHFRAKDRERVKNLDC